ncbi:hypothetical protein ACFYQ5_29770 [Streptomyces sp. NPDC005794]|uniref:hypothetical protein n=1 Tax=Streptomyces sp. NPDC005794 TaxID=3364733 RepID=UPI00368CF056
MSFIMLFTPWVSGAYASANAFGTSMQAAAPALIIVAVLALLILVTATLRSGPERRVLLTLITLIPATVLLVLYIVKVGDVQDLIDLNTDLGGGGVSTGVGLWLGLIFALATAAFTVVAVAWEKRRRDMADTKGPDRPAE